MTRVAAVDCGTHSLRLLVADVGDGRFDEVDRRMEVVRLGQGVDRTGELATEAMDRTFDACRGYAKAIDELGAERVRVVATSATRDARNRADFVSGIEGIFGVAPDVVTGDEEARLAFAGATRSLAGRDEFLPPFLVIDIGGGSTEFVIGHDEPTEYFSADIGSSRLHERHLHSDPPSPEQIMAAHSDVMAAIASAERALPTIRGSRTAVGVAGSVTTVAAAALRLERYDRAALHHARLATEDVVEAARRLLSMSVEQRTALPFMHPGRAHVIGAGALILSTVLETLGVPELVVSESDILDGIALDLA